METLILVAVGALIFALLLRPNEPHPPIIYMERDDDHNPLLPPGQRIAGCILPLVILVAFIVLFLLGK